MLPIDDIYVAVRRIKALKHKRRDKFGGGSDLFMDLADTRISPSVLVCNPRSSRCTDLEGAGSSKFSHSMKVYTETALGTYIYT